jgi:hypothetical protein
MQSSESNLRARASSPNVLITDTNRWPNAARLAIVLAKAGCNVSAVCSAGHPLLYTRAVQRTFRYGGLRPLESLANAIKAANPEIVIPCDDRGVEHLHELFVQARDQGTSGDSLAKLIERSLGAPANYATVSSRYDLLQAAREEGIRIPVTSAINSASDLKTWSECETFPCVLKADGTFGGRGIKIPKTLAQAQEFFLAMNRPHSTARVLKRFFINRDPFWIRPWWKRVQPAVIAQSFIHGRPANCAAFCWRGAVLACISVEVVSADGETGPASVVRVIDNAEMSCAAIKIARRLGLSGFFGLDFMIEDRTGSTYLIEMNPRCTPLAHLQLGPGHDLAAALWSQLSGAPLSEAPPVTLKQMIAYFPQAWNCKNDLLESSFQDIPRDEPELVKELLRPWPDRSLLFRIGNFFTTSAATHKSSQ